MKEQKLEALQNLIMQMHELMAKGEGDEVMEEGEMSEAMEDDGVNIAPEGKMIEKIALSDDMGEECDEDEKMNFMKGKVDRPKRKSLNIRGQMSAPKKAEIKEFMGLTKKKSKVY